MAAHDEGSNLTSEKKDERCSTEWVCRTSFKLAITSMVGAGFCSGRETLVKGNRVLLFAYMTPQGTVKRLEDGSND